MQLKYGTIKIPVSNEEKIKRVTLYMEDTDYPEGYCPKCDHGMVPKDLHIQFKKMFNSK